jgi:hypothetical protein
MSRGPRKSRAPLPCHFSLRHVMSTRTGISHLTGSPETGKTIMILILIFMGQPAHRHRYSADFNPSGELCLTDADKSQRDVSSISLDAAFFFSGSFSGVETRWTTSSVPGETAVSMGKCFPPGSTNSLNSMLTSRVGEKFTFRIPSVRFPFDTFPICVISPSTWLPTGTTRRSNAYTGSTTRPRIGWPTFLTLISSSSAMRSGVPLDTISGIESPGTSGAVWLCASPTHAKVRTKHQMTLFISVLSSRFDGGTRGCWART